MSLVQILAVMVHEHFVLFNSYQLFFKFLSFICFLNYYNKLDKNNLKLTENEC